MTMSSLPVLRPQGGCVADQPATDVAGLTRSPAAGRAVCDCDTPPQMTPKARRIPMIATTSPMAISRQSVGPSMTGDRLGNRPPYTASRYVIGLSPGPGEPTRGDRTDYAPPPASAE